MSPRQLPNPVGAEGAPEEHVTEVEPAGEATSDRLVEELAEVLDIDARRLTGDANLKEELGLDSMQFINCLVWLEELGIEVTDPIAALTTVDDILSLVRSRYTLGPSSRLKIGNGGLAAASATATSPVMPGHQDPLAPIMTNGLYTLRPVAQADTPFLYDLATQPNTGFRWRYRGNVPPIERFASEIWQASVLSQFVVVSASSGLACGLVVCYQADLVNGHAYIGAVFKDEAVRTGVPAAAVRLFVRYLFKIHPMRKLYFEVPGWNMDRLASGIGSVFQEEGCLHQHDYYDGQYWDKYILAVYRSQLRIPTAGVGPSPAGTIRTGPRTPAARAGGPDG